MKKILFPVDFSPVSLNAFTYALHLAKNVQAEIVILHVYELPGHNCDSLSPFLYANYEIAYLDKFENYKSSVPLLRKIAESQDLDHIMLTHVLKEGPVSEAILAVAREEMPDFIVMGSHGASGLSGTLFGSNTEKVINGSDVPVLAVRDGCRYEAISKILFLTQYKEPEVRVMDEVINVAWSFSAHLDVLEVRKRHRNNEAKMLKMWQKKYPSSNIEFNVLMGSDPEEIVLKFITQHKIDLLVMTVAHKVFFERLFLYSLSMNMAYHCVTPLLSIPIGRSDRDLGIEH